MFKYRLIQAFRNIFAAHPHSFLNMLGLTLGLSCSLFLFKYSQFEWNTNRFHKGIDDIYFATIRATPMSQPEYTSPTRFFKTDYTKFPEVVSHAFLALYPDDQIEHGEKGIKARVLVADSTFFQIFDFPLKSGDPKDILRNPKNLLLKPAVAQKLFGNEDPIGKEIQFQGEQFIVAGLLEEWRENSSLDFEVLIPYHSKLFWSKSGLECIRLHPGASIEPINTELEFSGRNHEQFPESRLKFVPFSDLYFNDSILSDQTLEKGNLRNAYILLLAAILILGISLFNYINIFLATLLRRSRDFGVKKVLGASRPEIGLEIILENLVSSTVTVWLSGILILYLTPWLQRFSEKPVTLSFPQDLIYALGLVVGLTALLSLYPIFRISFISSETLLRGRLSGFKNSTFRKWVIGIQFGISVALLIASLSFHRQLNFMLNRDLGIESEHIIKVDFNFQRPSDLVPRPEEANEGILKEFQQQLDDAKAKQKSAITHIVDAIEANPHLTDLSFGNTPLNTWEAPWKNMEGGAYHTIRGFPVTPNFKDLYGLEVVQGHFFDPLQDKSRENKVVINESAMRFFGFRDLEGASLANSYWGAEASPFSVIGVVKDFHYQHLSHPIAPLVMFYFDDRDESSYMMRIAEGKDQEALSFLSGLFEKYNSGKEFDYTYFDEEVKALYREDQRIVSIYTIFTIVGMIISAFGLFSISLFDVQQRVKEIGVRKVNGASTFQIMSLLLRRFLKIIGLAFLMACPIAWWGIHRYLENFAVRAPENGMIYLLSGLIALLIAVVTLIGQIYQTASANPVDSLRYE
ncbi:MAG: ABC transporter permease [Lewinella sp.]|nr:ABC transporter permease [Lewinella sp.]